MDCYVNCEVNQRAERLPLSLDSERSIDPEPVPALPGIIPQDFLNIEFWANPSVVAATLPAGLDPDLSAEGHANALFYDWQFTKGPMKNTSIPRATSIEEFFILLDALFEGKPVSYCPYIFVDNDAAIARGWTQGYPKRLGSVFQTRYYAATGKAGPALAAGSKFAGTVSAGGQRLAEGVVTLREDSVKDFIDSAPTAGREPAVHPASRGGDAG